MHIVPWLISHIFSFWKHPLIHLSIYQAIHPRLRNIIKALLKQTPLKQLFEVIILYFKDFTWQLNHLEEIVKTCCAIMWAGLKYPRIQDPSLSVNSIHDLFHLKKMKAEILSQDSSNLPHSATISIEPKMPNSAAIIAISQPAPLAPQLIMSALQTGQTLLQSSSCYIVACHSIGAALFVCAVIWWQSFLSVCPLWLDRGHVSGWEIRGGKKKRVGGSKVFLQGLKLVSPTHCELLHAWNVCECVRAQIKLQFYKTDRYNFRVKA